jgi:hypothetical protein
VFAGESLDNGIQHHSQNNVWPKCEEEPEAKCGDEEPGDPVFIAKFAHSDIFLSPHTRPQFSQFQEAGETLAKGAGVVGSMAALVFTGQPFFGSIDVVLPSRPSLNLLQNVRAHEFN